MPSSDKSFGKFTKLFFFNFQASRYISLQQLNILFIPRDMKIAQIINKKILGGNYDKIREEPELVLV